MVTDEQRQKIIGIIVSAIIGVAVGIAGVFGISVLAGCASTGSADWNIEVSPMEGQYGSF